MGQILVTGGAGRIGSQVCRLLAAARHQVRAFDLPAASFDAVAGVPSIEPVPGELTDPASVGAAVAGVDVVVHLAALLPPVSQRERAHTLAVNVGGTRTLIEAMHTRAPAARLVFSSSVVVYGDTTAPAPPVTVDRPLAPRDIYAESKVAAEAVVRGSSLAWSILRISGVAVPEVLEPPDPWPFTRDQRLEFVLREDVAAALALAARTDAFNGHTVHVSGGPSWQTTGERYALDYLDVLGLPADMATFLDTSQAFDWYAPNLALVHAGFAPTPYATYLDRLRAAVQAFIAEA